MRISPELVTLVSDTDITASESAMMLGSSGRAEWEANLETLRITHGDTSPFTNLEGQTIARPRFKGSWCFPRNYVAWFNANSARIQAILANP